MRTVITCAVALTLAACATTSPTIQGKAWNPQVDPKGVDQARYEKDLVECRAYADQSPHTDDKAAAKKGAVRTGAMSAALIGAAAVATGGLALLPAMAGTAAVAGGAGAAGGAMSGKMEADLKYQNMVGNCLTGRGYKVLG